LRISLRFLAEFAENRPLIYAFAEYELDTGLYELRRAGRRCAIEPQVFDVLLFLLRHRDRVVTRNDLLDGVWGDRFVSEAALSSRINAARRALGDTGREQRHIRTVHGRGYRFVGMVAERDDDAPPPPAAGPPARSPVSPAVMSWEGAAGQVVGQAEVLERLRGLLDR
jgi:DNA-binding winged helix-turn-helix (wHTH) protein